MPELPEVEVVKMSLRKKIQNLTIKNVRINEYKLRYKIDKEKIFSLVGKKITKIQRRSKFLIFHLNNDLAMLVHLGMTGKFFLVNRKNKRFKTSFYYHLDNEKDRKHNHVIFFFKENKKLIYNDVRKFGFIKLYNLNDLKKNSHFFHLGPEPLEKNYNFNYLKRFIKNKKRTIKDILMDQKCVSGLGNIYVNEILFQCKIHPLKKVKNLKNKQIIKIIKFTKKILLDSIKSGGSSIKDFSSSDGKKGIFQQKFNVYGRKGLKCSNSDCKYIIKSIKISNRTTFYCANCQKY